MEEGIYYKEGVYVVIKSENSKSHENIVCNLEIRNVSLYGGRVEINYSGAFRNHKHIICLTVDGIPIVDINHERVMKNVYFSKAVSYLNAIEANGVDAFIQHYKQSVELLYGELKDLNQKTEIQLSSEQDESIIKGFLSQIENIRSLLLVVLGILFSLSTYMAAGLENEKVISVCQSIVNSFA